jgi:hypothetical protein
MFTFGIFSTHLPYLAFVFIYAIFFFFGIQKASGEQSAIENRNDILLIKTVSKTDHSYRYDFSSFHGHNDGKLQLTDFKFPLRKIIKIIQRDENKILYSELFSALYCRPPPCYKN